jgi:hypothetical protein
MLSALTASTRTYTHSTACSSSATPSMSRVGSTMDTTVRPIQYVGSQYVGSMAAACRKCCMALGQLKVRRSRMPLLSRTCAAVWDDYGSYMNPEDAHMNRGVGFKRPYSNRPFHASNPLNRLGAVVAGPHLGAVRARVERRDKQVRLGLPVVVAPHRAHAVAHEQRSHHRVPAWWWVRWGTRRVQIMNHEDAHMNHELRPMRRYRVLILI